MRIERPFLLLDTADEGDGGGAGDGKPDPAKELEALKAQNKELLTKIETLSKSKNAPDNTRTNNSTDPDLREQARKDRESEEKRKSEARALESAIKFNMNKDQWLKTNSSLLPKDIQDIFKASDKETYSNAIEKDSALKSGILQSFFSVQANRDLLTESQKGILDEYLGLTKTEKQNRAMQIYDSVFEPTFEMLKRIKKAESLNNGFGSGGGDDAYKEKLQRLSKKHYLGEKHGS